MARSTPTYSSGTLPAVGSGQIQNVINKLVEKLTEHQSGGVNAWSLADQIDTGANYEAVFHSLGDRSLGSGAGDTDIWLYIHLATDDVTVEVAQDYSPTTGVWSTGAYRNAGGQSISNISDTAAVDWFSVCNEYEFYWYMLQSGNWQCFHVGQLIRPYSSALNGVARTTSQSGTGNGVVFGLDRDITANIKVGQYVWLVNQTPDGLGIQSVGVDLCPVQAITSNSITLDGVTNTYANGSLVGIDPAANYIAQGSASTIYFVSNMDGTYTTPTGSSGSVANPLVDLVDEAEWDPGPDQMYYGGQPFVKMGSNPSGFRGKMQHRRVFTFGTQVDQDIMEIDYDANQRWKCFVTSAVNGFSGHVNAIGPGAT